MSIRVLWVTNQPIAKHCEMLNMTVGQSGGWMEKSYEALKDASTITLGVATIYNGKEVLHSIADGNDFFVLPSRHNIGAYDQNDAYNLRQWEAIVSEFRPDIIHLWGTEYAIGLCALKAAKGIPSVVYMQGMLNQLANHYCDGVSLAEQLRYITPIDIKRWDFLWSRKKRFEKAAKREVEILKLSKNVIVESDWCAYNCLSVVPDCTVYRSALPISSVFFDYEWSYDRCEKYSIFTVAGGYPIKGHHILLKAFANVVKIYPEAKLYIPGASNVLSSDFKSRIRLTTYENLISSLIHKYHLKNNIIYTGKLTPEQMAKQIAKCNVYVMPSSCENHSSSLVEAMIVGAPTISSYVGGISHYYKDRENGFFYRFDEPEVLSAIIVNYFCDNGLARQIADKGKYSARLSRSAIDLKKDLETIYDSVIHNNKLQKK